MKIQSPDIITQLDVSGSVYVSGSLEVIGSITGISYTGDGSGLTGIVSASYAVTASYIDGGTY